MSQRQYHGIHPVEKCDPNDQPEKPFRCRGVVYRDEDSAYDALRQREIDEGPLAEPRLLDPNKSWPFAANKEE